MKDRRFTHKKTSENENSCIAEDYSKMKDGCLTYTDPVHGDNFLKKLYDLYRREELCDVKLIVGEKYINTHKSVLASNTPYFEGMFLSNLMESKQDSVNIQAIPFEILQCLVEFCYTSTVEVNNENALELLSAANMLQFDGIKQCCCKYLQEQLDAENCLTIVRFADLYTCYTLKQVADEFTRKNFQDVLQTEEFLNLSFDYVKSILSSDNISITSEINVFRAIITWVQHDEENRKQFFYELFQMIRLIHIPPKLLDDVIEQHDYVSGDIKCIKLLSKAKTNLLLPLNYQQEGNGDQNKPRQLLQQSSVYLIGGETRRQVFDSLDCFSLQKGKWFHKTSMSTPRDGLAATTYDGKIYVAGGYDGNSSLKTCEYYTPELNEWKTVQEMSEPRHAFSMTTLQGWLYIAGGSDFDNTEYNSVERYDPIRNTWTPVAHMNNKREGLVLLAHDRVLYALGGENGVSILNTVERFDPRVGVWCNCSSMGYRRRYFGVAVLNDKIYSVGGSDYEEDLNSVETFEERTNRWIPIPSMNKRRESVAVVAIDNKILAMGGACINKELDSIEVYDPVVNKWEEFGNIPRSKEGMGAVVL